MIEKILNDLNKKLNIKTDINEIKYFHDGHTNSQVFSINNQFIIKTFSKKNLKNQIIFYNKYQNIDIFPKIIYFNDKLNYICFTYIKGNKYSKNINSQNIINQIYNIVNK